MNSFRLQINRWIGLLLMVASVLLLSACHKDKVKSETFSSDSAHTLLIYIVGDNDLASYAPQNISLCVQGLEQSSQPINLVVYQDVNKSSNNLPVLFQLKMSDDRQKVDTVYIKRWKEELDSTDPKVLTEVINLTFSTFPSQVLGIDLWSHGMSWIPSPDYSAGISRAMSYFGKDNSHFMELWELRQALQNADYHLDYILFDACHMATAEVAYELRDCCDYMLASATEIMGYGFPYRSVVRSLSACQSRGAGEGRSSDAVREVMRRVFNDFRKEYERNGTLTLFDMAQVASLRTAFRATARPAELTLDDEPDLQNYGRRRTASRYYFYDLLDVCGDDAEVTAAIDRCVDCCYASPKFDDGYEELILKHSCGIAISVPQYFGKAKSPESLQSAYQLLQWNQ